MKVTIELGETKATIEDADSATVEEAVQLCSNALSAVFGYGIKLDYETYYVEKEKTDYDY